MEQRRASPPAPPRRGAAPARTRSSRPAPAPRSPSHSPRLHARERPAVLVPHAAAPKAPQRAPGRSWRPHELRRHLAQSATEQREAADRHCHGCNPGFQTEDLPPVARVLTAAGRAPPPPSPAGEQVPLAAGSGASCRGGARGQAHGRRAGPGVKLRSGLGAGLEGFRDSLGA